MVRKQRGFTLFELLITLGVTMVLVSLGLKKERLDIEQTRSKATGLKIAQINNAIRKRLADEGSSIVAGNYTGVDWLHDTSCTGGLASKAYLPCNIDGNFHFSLTPVTTVTNTAGSVAASTNFGAIMIGSKNRMDLAKLAVLTANNENLHGETPVIGTFYSYNVSAGGEIIAVSDYDAGLDQWLRTDGTNAMQANLDLGGNQIANLGAAVIGAACSSTGLVAQQNGILLSCVAGVWQRQGSDYWLDPVANYASLPFTDPVGTVRLTLDSGRAFRWSGAAWTALAVDQNGDLTVPNTLNTGDIQLNTIVTENTACSENGRIARNSEGLTLSCQAGTWTQQFQLPPTAQFVDFTAAGVTYLGRFKLCSLSRIRIGGTGSTIEIWHSGSYTDGTKDWWGMNLVSGFPPEGRAQCF